MPKKSSTEYKIYSFICKNPGLNTYALSKKLGMSGGRVRHALSRLREKRLVKFKFDKNNPRIRKLTYPVEARSLLPRSIKQRLKRMIRK